MNEKTTFIEIMHKLSILSKLSNEGMLDKDIIVSVGVTTEGGYLLKYKYSTSPVFFKSAEEVLNFLSNHIQEVMKNRVYPA